MMQTARRAAAAALVAAALAGAGRARRGRPRLAARFRTVSASSHAAPRPRRPRPGATSRPSGEGARTEALLARGGRAPRDRSGDLGLQPLRRATRTTRRSRGSPCARQPPDRLHVRQRQVHDEPARPLRSAEASIYNAARSNGFTFCGVRALHRRGQRRLGDRRQNAGPLAQRPPEHDARRDRHGRGLPPARPHAARRPHPGRRARRPRGSRGTRRPRAVPHAARDGRARRRCAPRAGDYLRPSRFVAELDARLSPLRRAAAAPNPTRPSLPTSIRYGDPFDRPVSRPFDSFELARRTSPTPARPGSRGSRSAGSSAGGTPIAGSAAAPPPSRASSWTSTTRTTTRGSSARRPFRFGLLSLRPLGKGAELRTEAPRSRRAARRAPERPPSRSPASSSGAPYDYGPGAPGFTAGLRVEAPRARPCDARRTALFWTHTSNGISRNSSLQTFRAEARVPVAGAVSRWAAPGRGASAQRPTTNTTRSARTRRSGRAFVSWIFR